ncbi:MAG: PilZ domain-containing protein [Desulfobacteraceae bacterium]|nr:PilZ domain-containing protein [Desulfobacteraceae bacterium]
MSIELVLVSVVLTTILIAFLLAIYKVLIRNIKKRIVPINGIQAMRTSSMSDWDEKRRDFRIDILWPVLMETSRGELKAKIKDLGPGGAFIACQEPLRLKEQFNLIINMPDQKPLRLISEVVWSNSNVPDDKIVTRGMGISFTQNTQENRKSYNNAIVSYLGEHQKNLVDSGHHGYNRHTERPVIEKNVSDLF